MSYSFVSTSLRRTEIHNPFDLQPCQRNWLHAGRPVRHRVLIIDYTFYFLFPVNSKNELINFMGHSPSSEASRSSASREIFWKVKVNHHAHKSPPSVPMLSQANQVHLLPLDVFNIRFSIFIPAKPSFTKLSLSVRFHTEILYAYISLFHQASHAPQPSNPQS